VKFAQGAANTPEKFAALKEEYEQLADKKISAHYILHPDDKLKAGACWICGPKPEHGNKRCSYMVTGIMSLFDGVRSRAGHRAPESPRVNQGMSINDYRESFRPPLPELTAESDKAAARPKAPANAS
jgi:DnaJ-class molecular chaperone